MAEGRTQGGFIGFAAWGRILALRSFVFSKHGPMAARPYETRTTIEREFSYAPSTPSSMLLVIVVVVILLTGLVRRLLRLSAGR